MRPSCLPSPLLSLALLLTSCAAELPLAQVDQAVREASCERQVRCGAAESVELCVQMQQRWLSGGAALLQPRVDSGALTYDGAEAARCVEALRQAACDVPVDAFCFSVRGTRQAGEACAWGDECQEGLWCAPQQDVCGGTCRPRVALGEEAPSPAACPPQSRWDVQTHRCEPELQEGEACTTEGGLGFALSGCASGLWCNSTSGTCRPVRQVEEGGACGEEARCRVGLTCTAGTCTPLARSGEACAGAWGEGGASCRFGLACVPGTEGSDTCQPPQETGAPCHGDDDCRLPLACLARPGESAPTCQARGGAGAACDGRADCDAAHYCGLEAAQCRPWADLPACPTQTPCPGQPSGGVLGPGQEQTPTCRP